MKNKSSKQTSSRNRTRNQSSLTHRLLNMPMNAKALFASGSGLVVLGSILLLTVFVSTSQIQQEQDISSDASIDQGQVTISALHSPVQPAENQESAFVLKANTRSSRIEKLTLQFDIITDTTEELQVTGISPELNYQIEKEDVNHGFMVTVTATPKAPNIYFITGNISKDIVRVGYTPIKPGRVELNFDREVSQAIVYQSDPPEDQLTHVDVFTVTVPGNDIEGVPLSDDFYFLDDQEDNFEFFETSGSQNEVNGSELVEGRSYRVRFTGEIQNRQDNTVVAEDPIITARMKVNDDETVDRTFRRANLTGSDNPLEMTFETTFEAEEKNNFSVTIDALEVFAETDEDNNTASANFSGSAETLACNQVCESNGECGSGYRCYDTGDEKRCRLATNLKSSSCTNPYGVGNRTCNQRCADTSECADGYTCWFNQCRNPYNVESDSCAAPSSQVQSEITEGCNVSCSSNADCAVNLRCYNGGCRLATNPSSTSCSADVGGVVTKGYVKATPTPTAAPTATPRATVRPTATPSPSATASATTTPRPTPTTAVVASPLPTATPTPTPEPQADETALQSVLGMLTGIFNTEDGGFSGAALLPIIIILAGVLLLIMAIVVILKPSRGTEAPIRAPETNSTLSGVQPGRSSRPNPPPPPLPGHGTIMPQGGFKDSDGKVSKISSPDVIETPEESAARQQGGQPAQPSAASQEQQTQAETAQDASQTPQQQPSTNQSGGTGGTMMDRLKSKGIEIQQDDSNKQS